MRADLGNCHVGRASAHGCSWCMRLQAEVDYLKYSTEYHEDSYSEVDNATDERAIS